jgi:tetratricopeptide (TPR) repeat protein
MLKSQRQRLHARIGNELEAKLGTVVEGVPEVIAHHYAEAGMHETAIDWWYKAGEQAVARSANVEAIAILNKAIAVLDLIPDRAVLRNKEFAILTTLGSALGPTKGYRAPETKNAYMKALEISKEIGDVARGLPALFGVWASFHAAGQHTESCRLLEEFSKIAQDYSPEYFHSVSRWMLIQELFIQGRFKEAIAVLDEKLKYGLHINDDNLALEIGEHPLALMYGFASWAYLFLGNIGQSILSMNEGMKIAKSSNHINSIAENMVFECVMHLELGDIGKSHKCAAQSIVYAEQQEIPAWAAVARVLKGLSECHLGGADDSIALIRHGLADWQRQYSLLLPHLNLYHAKACLVMGRFDEGLEAIKEGSERAAQCEDRTVSAELHRVRGELLSAGGRAPKEEVEICFRDALDVAREQQAKTFELRAATSLARLWSDRGEQQRAHDLLAPIYGWFTDGFGTRDLIEAKVVIDALG